MPKAPTSRRHRGRPATAAAPTIEVSRSNGTAVATESARPSVDCRPARPQPRSGLVDPGREERGALRAVDANDAVGAIAERLELVEDKAWRQSPVAVTAEDQPAARLDVVAQQPLDELAEG